MPPGVAQLEAQIAALMKRAGDVFSIAFGINDDVARDNYLKYSDELERQARELAVRMAATSLAAEPE
jgi:hypothetical protein